MNDNRERAIEAIQKLVTCYPRFALAKTTLHAYADHLAQVPIDLLELTLYELAESSTFFPSIAEILQRVNGKRPPTAKVTGYRFVRGSHGSTYVRDEEGIDTLPSWMQPA